jgi:hypothetical protein
MMMQHPPPSQLHRAPNGLPTQMPNAHHSQHNPSNSNANNSQSIPSNMSNQMYNSGVPPHRNIVYMPETYSSQPTLQPTSQMQQMMPAQQFLPQGGTPIAFNIQHQTQAKSALPAVGAAGSHVSAVSNTDCAPSK